MLEYLVQCIRTHCSPRLKEAEEARTTCVAIEGLECSQELSTSLQQHAEVMTELYRVLNKLTQAQVNDQSAYSKLFDQANTYSAWYKARKKVANSMRQAATRAD